MEAPFRLRLRKGEGVSKKGPMVVKHPVSPVSSFVGGIGSGIAPVQNGKEVRSPIAAGGGGSAAAAMHSHRRRPLSPESRMTRRKDELSTTNKSPKSSPSRQSNHPEKNKSPTAPRRYASRCGVYNGGTKMVTKSQVPQSPASPTLKRSPPTSPLIRKPFIPAHSTRNREEGHPKGRAVPLKAIHPPGKVLSTPSPNSTLTLQKGFAFGNPNPACTSTRKLSSNSNYRPPSPRNSSPKGTNSRGASPKASSSRGSSPRGRGSSPGAKPPLISEETLRARVQRVYKERLYLLHQPGPNSFSVGLDSPKHKYKVIIGPQNCSCGHGPFCIHVLFIMVRVLQVSEKNPLLAMGSLKDFEVEQLLRGWEERRKTAIRSRERRALGLLDTKERLPFLFPPSKDKEGSASTQCLSSTKSGLNENGSNEFDNQCPICLMSMVEGESLVACETGCRNFLHHHCMAVWATDRQCNGQPLLCPLCRAPWSFPNGVKNSPNMPGPRLYARQANSSRYNADYDNCNLARNLSSYGLNTCESSPYVNAQNMSASFSGLASPLRVSISPTQVGMPPMSRSLSAAYPHNAISVVHGSGHRASPRSPDPSVRYAHYPPTVRGEVSADFVNSAAEELVPLPHSEPIPLEHEQTAQSWVNVFGRDLIACLFSRDWVVRETGLRRLSHEVVKVLRWDRLVTSEQNRNKVITCCANILAQVANDPVYKVYLACLRCVRVLLAHLWPSNANEVSSIQELFRPLLHTLLLKCADGNRRTSQISIDSLIELCRGQKGELALGSHASSHTTQEGAECSGMGGICYVLSCILEDNPPTEAPWQWLLGRLCILDKLLDEFPSEFQLQVVQPKDSEAGYQLQHYNRLLSVVEFAFKALGSSHTTVAKLARRIYICGAKMSAAEPAVFNQVCDMLGKLDMSLQMRLKRRLRGTPGHGERKGSLAKLGDMFPLAEQGTRLVRSVSHSPSRMFSAFRSSSQSPARHLFSKSKDVLAEKSQKYKEKREFVLLPDKKSFSKMGPIQEKSKPSPPRPNHLPLDSVEVKFKEKQAKLRSYYKSKAKQELPLIVQEAIISPTRDNYMKPKSSRTGLSQSYGDNLNQTLSPLSPAPKAYRNPMSPQTPLSKAAPSLLKDALSTPVTPSAPNSTPTNEPKLVVLGQNVVIPEPPLPAIPGLDFLPKYLQENVGVNDKELECRPYEEGCDWFKGPLLGTGAFSSCYQARDVSTGTLMAVKQVSICRNSEEEQERVEAAVEEEVLLMCKLKHPHIVRMIGTTRLPTSFSVFTEWMAGGSVAGMLERYGAFSEPVIIKYTRQILDGLAYLHDNMVLHRDLKGANLLIDSSGQWLRIGDLGTAARLASKATITDEFRGQLLGTIAFMAPEVLRGDNYGRACDVWSVGCCMIEMATTKPPWGAENVSNQYKLMFRIATSNGPPDVPECLSEETRDMALKCLQINSEQRPSSKELLNHSVFHNLPP